MHVLNRGCLQAQCVEKTIGYCRGRSLSAVSKLHDNMKSSRKQILKTENCFTLQIFTGFIQNKCKEPLSTQVRSSYYIRGP